MNSTPDSSFNPNQNTLNLPSSISREIPPSKSTNDKPTLKRIDYLLANLRQKLGISSNLQSINETTATISLVAEKSESINHVRDKELRTTNTSINNHPVNEGGYGEFSSEIETLINIDRENIAQAVIFFSTNNIQLTTDMPALTRACQQLIAHYMHLFQNPDDFKVLWNQFANSRENHHILTNTIPALVTEENPSGIRYPEFDLEAMAYHSYRHANEMYKDTYKKCVQLQLPESTCKAAATMGFFHDLIQKVDDPFPKPALGKNEIITTKFLNFIINHSLIDPLMKKVLISLSNATIVGGTFLIRVLTPQGEKRNISLSHYIDDSHCISDSLFKNSIDVIKKMRRILAENDVSRTLNKNEFILTEAMKQNPIIIRLTTALKENATDEQWIEAREKEILEENFGAHLISRLFQSIRFLSELNKIPVKEIRDPAISKAQAIDKIPISFIDTLKLATTWTLGNFSEMAFAEQSQHTDYVNMLKRYSDTLINSEINDMKDLIFLAFTEGQDGNSIDIMQEIQ